MITLLNFSVAYLVCFQLLRNQMERLVVQSLIFVSGGEKQGQRSTNFPFLGHPYLLSAASLRLECELSLTADSPFLVASPTKNTFHRRQETPCSAAKVNEGDI